MKGSIKYQNNTIIIGHNPRRIKNCTDQPHPQLDTTKLFDESYCVVHHLSSIPGIKCSDIKLNQIDEMNEKVKIISDYITDQNPDLWKIMKRGDLIEINGHSINEKHRRSDRLYIVDKDPAPRDLGIIKNGLIIKPLYTDYDQYGTIYPNMFSITEFPLGYFDKVVINDYLSPPSFRSTRDMDPPGQWKNNKSPVCFDVKKLKLNRLSQDNVFITINEIVGKESYQVNYLYVIVKYKTANYMIIRECSNKYFTYCIEKELERFINLFKKSVLIECYDIDYLDLSMIKSIALKETVEVENICCI
jgi:hypothetical protein